ncbi:MAG: peptidylprolyl isomerase [Acidobacteria bacterium]|nr:peptidylprolyl isomerase [Acidobacteriota bacterium]
MRNKRICWVVLVAAVGVVASALFALQKGAIETATDKVLVAIVTEAGTIEVELDAKHAPVTVANFLRYMDAAYYDGGRFHRTVKLHPDNQPNNVVKIEVIQAGPRGDPNVPASERKDSFPPIALERTNKTGILHKDGVISMARLEPDTATGDFFICVGDQPELDFGGKRNPDGQGFAAFGRVVQGMDVVRKIHQSSVEAQRLTPPVKILSIRRK